MHYWLLKTEPSSYSIDDLKCDKQTAWTGVRNYQVRNTMRDLMRVGDRCFVYHSSAGDETGIAGEAMVASSPYPDPTQFEVKSDYYDPKATQEKPIWFVVDIQFVKKFSKVFLLSQIKKVRSLSGMGLLKQGSRLSIQPVAKGHWDTLFKLANK